MILLIRDKYIDNVGCLFFDINIIWKIKLYIIWNLINFLRGFSCFFFEILIMLVLNFLCYWYIFFVIDFCECVNK